MLKRSLVILIIVVIALAGCGKEKTNEEVYNDIQKTLTDMESYSCTVRANVTGSSTSGDYQMLHIFKSPDKYYIKVIKPEYIAGKTTIYNGKKTIVKQPKINQSWELNSFNSTPESKGFLGSFIYPLLNNEEVNLSRDNVEGVECLVIETIMPGDKFYSKTGKVWMSVKKHKPIKMQIYDKENTLRMDIRYGEFAYNEDVQDSLFEP